MSVIVPIYNTHKFLRKCLESLVNQTLQPIEIILVNDGSTDLSQTVIDDFVVKYPNKVLSFIQNNRGQSSARNLGISYVSGEFLTFVDSDDWIEYDALEKMYFIAKQNHSDIVVCDISIHKQGIVERTNFLKVFEKNKYLAQKFCWGKIYKTKFWQGNGFTFTEGIYYEDLELTPKILFETNKISLINECLYNYNINNPTSTTKLAKKTKYIFFIFDSLVKFYQTKPYNHLYEQFLLSVLFSIFLNDYNGEYKPKIREIFQRYDHLVRFINCINMHQRFIVFCLRLGLPLHLIYILINVRRKLKIFMRGKV